MNRVLNHGLRAGAAAVGVATGLMVLASTSQTPDGFIRASFGGPLDIFGTSSANIQTDVLAIGDGPNDAAELASLLKGPVHQGSDPNSPFRVAYEAGAAPNTNGLPAFPTPGAVGAPITDQSLSLPMNQVVDSKGRVDCTGATSCQLDPVTNITTLTYADGIVATVQKVNDMTVVAFKTAANNLQQQVQTFIPSAPVVNLPPWVAAPMPAAAVPIGPAPAAPAIDPGPAAPESQVPSPSSVRPRINGTRPPLDLTPGHSGNSGVPNPITQPKIPGLDQFKDTIGSVVDVVTGAVGKALNPGASVHPNGS